MESLNEIYRKSIVDFDDVNKYTVAEFNMMN